MKTGDIWSARSFERVVVCPVPNCNHFGQVITKAHCRMAHGMEREEIASLYGLPQEMRVQKSLSKNKKPSTAATVKGS